MLVTPDFLDPSGLSAVELPLGHERGQALVVGVDRGVSAFEVAAPFAESLDECVEFLFPSGVAGDGVRMFTRKEAYGVRIVGGRGTLQENCAHSKVGRVRVDLKRKRKVG